MKTFTAIIFACCLLSSLSTQCMGEQKTVVLHLEYGVRIFNPSPEQIAQNPDAKITYAPTQKETRPPATSTPRARKRPSSPPTALRRNIQRRDNGHHSEASPGCLSALCCHYLWGTCSRLPDIDD